MYLYRTVWTVKKYSGGAWVDDGILNGNTAIPAPRENGFSEPIETTFEAMTLANGGQALVFPQIIYINKNLDFYWSKADSTLKAKLENWLQTNMGLRFTTHISGRVFEGYLKFISSEWIIGLKKELYNITVTFVPFTVA